MNSWRSLYDAAPADVVNLRNLLEATPAIDEACNYALARCQEYAQQIADSGLHYKPSDKATRNAREVALLAIKELESRLSDAKPSETARILGIW